jgi:serine/threonine-protein kinase RsbW
VVNGERPPRCEFDREQLVTRFEATVPGSIDVIPSVVEQIMVVVREMGCAAGKEFDIEVAVNEALANAVEHGCGHDSSQQVEVLVECDPEHGMLIVVRDPGSGFDPAKVPSPVVGERLYADHGRGIYLINQLMDEVRYERGGTEIWMRKR